MSEIRKAFAYTLNQWLQVYRRCDRSLINKLAHATCQTSIEDYLHVLGCRAALPGRGMYSLRFGYQRSTEVLSFGDRQVTTRPLEQLQVSCESSIENSKSTTHSPGASPANTSCHVSVSHKRTV